MAGHAQLKFVMTECSKTQNRLTGSTDGEGGTISFISIPYCRDDKTHDSESGAVCDLI